MDMKEYWGKSSVRQKGSNAGFTLMELMITAAILIIAITGLLAAFISAAMLSQANHNKVIAVNDAQYVLEKLRDMTYNDLSSHTETDFTNLNLDNELMNVVVSEASGVKTLIVNVTWTERQKTESFSITTQIAQ
jgi:Tfp pilus assembly protein PilV